MSKLWGGRFQDSTDSLMERFSSSIGFDKELYREDIMGSVAHATMLGRCGIISLEESKTLCEGLKSVQKKIEEGRCEFSESDEDIHMNIERLLGLEIGPLAGKLHTARSRNDQVATDLHLYVRRNILEVGERILKVQAALLFQVQQNGKAIMPGYTHLQRAQPILFGQNLLAYIFMLQRDFERMMQGWKHANKLPLGAGALAGTKHPIDRDLTASLLNCDSIYENSLDAVSDRDFVAEFLFNASLIMIHLSRFSEELILWSSQEFGFVELDDKFCTGSSLMPQKKNPDVPELIRGKSGRVVGSLVSLLTTMKGLPLAYNRDMQEDKEPLFDCVKTLISVLEILEPLVRTMRIHPDRMLECAEQGYMNATDLADYLVAKDIPFREAHSIAGRLVRVCLDRKLALKDLPLSEFQKISSTFKEDVYSFIELQQVVDSKKSKGGTSYSEVKRQTELVKGFLESNKKHLKS